MNQMIGKVLKHYQIESLIGRGGMGVVYKARDTRLQRPVALKLLRSEIVADGDRKNRFLLEARSAAALTHPGIAQVYDIDEVEGNLFIAMEFVDGRTVTGLIADGELDLLGSVEVALQISEALAKAHDSGILHRDIKSDNIMITRDGHAKLLDFGLAKLLDLASEGSGQPLDLSRTLTKDRVQTLPGAIMGTLSYMSPEQARGQELDSRSDLFSLGIVLYEMVTGELPFKGDSPIDTMHAIAYEEARPVTTVRRNLPGNLHRIVFNCLRKRPEDRYANAHALAADLKRLKHDIESGTSLALPAGQRLHLYIDRLKSSIPFGSKGAFIFFAALALTAALVIFRINWAALIGYAVLALFVYRFVRNRKKRMLNGVVRKLVKSPNILAVLIKGDKITIIADKAQASLFLRVTSLVEGINKKLYFAKHVESEVKSAPTPSELQTLLKQTGVVYAREDLVLEPDSRQQDS